MNLTTLKNKILTKQKEVERDIEKCRMDLQRASWCREHGFQYEAQHIQDVTQPVMSVLLEARALLEDGLQEIERINKKQKETDTDYPQQGN